ncbi:MAG: acetyl-CoA carboxylase biotin carboxyl carrier protein [Gemmatimonadota bacterium]|nr:acetyl-CoA carboxylase biotin carboxyl carrier protein [Gemmatimonadota bacterium]
MDLEFLRGLIAAVDESGIDSMEISRGGTRIRIAKTPPPSLAAPGGTTHPASAPVSAPAPALPATTSEAPVPTLPSTPPPSKGQEVKSPMVGTFYSAPAPEAPPYVEIGTRVVKGQTLCILEAMKLMNELEAEFAGTVREIAVANAEPVEYGQLLFRIEPDA